ncbi:MAG TPA: chaplin family protein [Acidimicrobiales bacterium]|nr:chaplin family protein [Acidimicrobiales bacterium]
MHILVEKLARTALLAAGLLLVVGVAPAQAQDAPSGSSSDGVLAGNVVNVDLDVPVTICGLLSALFGTGVNGCTTLPISIGSDAAGSGAQGDGVVSGNALTLDADIPISLGGPGATTCQPNCAPTTCCVPPTTCCVPPTTCYCTTTSTSTSTTTSSSTTSSSTSTPSSSVPPSTAPPSVRHLPVTGGDLGHQLPIGAGLVGAGALFVWVSRRRMARID